MRKLLTGEPYAGKLPVRFGGRGDHIFPTPIKQRVNIPPRAPIIGLDLDALNVGGKIKSILIMNYLKKSFKKYLRSGHLNK